MRVLGRLLVRVGRRRLSAACTSAAAPSAHLAPSALRREPFPSFVARRSTCTEKCGAPVLRACAQCSKQLDLLSEERLICSACETVQPVSPELNWFEYLGLPGVAFELDDKDLKQRFHGLQQLVHPDRFASKGKAALAAAEAQSARLNSAYSALSGPLSRAEYILELEGRGIQEEEMLVDDPRFLMEIMELNESIQDAECKEDVEDLAADISSSIADFEAKIAAAFARKDFDEMKKQTNEMRYHCTALENAHKKLGFVGKSH